MENLSAYLLLALRLLMALALLSFLAWALYTLWRDLRKEANSLTAQRVPPIRVQLPGQPGSEEQQFTTPEITIGRHPRCEWVLGHETVSSEHARLVFHHEQWWLEDLASRNGTYLNGDAVADPVVLADQDQVRCGQVNFIVSFEGTNP